MVHIYIFIQLRKHYSRALRYKCHQKWKFEIPIHCMRDITKGSKMGERGAMNR